MKTQGKERVDAADRFARIANRCARLMGTHWAFMTAATVIIGWLVSGPFYHFSDTWQLVVNTGTTIVTFLMVFLIQNTQNRDAKAIQLKLDEIIRAIGPADNEMIDTERLSDRELDRLTEKYEKLRQAHAAQGRGERGKVKAHGRNQTDKSGADGKTHG